MVTHPRTAMIIMTVTLILPPKAEKHTIKHIILAAKFDHKSNDDSMLLIESFIITTVGYIEYHTVVLM